MFVHFHCLRNMHPPCFVQFSLCKIFHFAKQIIGNHVLQKMCNLFCANLQTSYCAKAACNNLQCFACFATHFCKTEGRLHVAHFLCKAFLHFLKHFYARILPCRSCVQNLCRQVVSKTCAKNFVQKCTEKNAQFPFFIF